jgi:hypothetical protein
VIELASLLEATSTTLVLVVEWTEFAQAVEGCRPCDYPDLWCALD